MKYLVLLFTFLIYSNLKVNAQLLLQNKDGDPLFLPLISNSESQNINKSGLFKLNTGDQSFGFDYFNAPKSIGKPKYKLWTFGAKTKPTEGYAAVLKNGQFSPGVNLSASITQVKIFDKEDIKPENGFFDWGSIYLNYTINKYQFYKSDTPFISQVYSTNFTGFGFGVNYNILIKSKFLASFKFGYSRKNNFDDLTSLEVRDIKTSFDASNNITREIIVSKTAKQGIYKEFDSYPINISFTKLTPDDPSKKGLTFGYSVYISSLPTNNDKPITNLGCILYLSKMTDGISTPVLGLNFQFSDFFDTKDINNGLLKRLSIGITSNLSVF